MFAKSSVVGPSANPFFVALSKSSGQTPKWNFYKYLVDREGKVVATYPSDMAPLDTRLTSQIERLLDAK
jgi:glutathione peroxidase